MKRSALLLLLLLLGFHVCGQQITAPRIVNFTSRDYEGHAQNFCVLEDSAGLIYVGNVNGLYQYDGDDWKSYSPNHNPLVVSLAIGSDHTLYFGGLSEFGMLAVNEKGTDGLVSLSDRLPDSLSNFNFVWQTYALGDAVYFNLEQYIVCYQNDELNVIKAPAGDSRIFKVNGEIWLASREKGLYKLVDDDFVELHQSAFFAGKNVSSIRPYKSLGYAVLTREGEMYMYRDDQDHLVVPLAERYRNTLAEAVPYNSIILRNGNVVVNTLQDGVFIFDSNYKLLRHLTRSDGLQNATVIGVFEDHNNLLWCALDNGVSVIDLSSRLTYAYEGDQFFGAVQDINKRGEELFVATIQGLYRVSLKDSLPSFDKIEGVPGLCFDLELFRDEMLAGASTLVSVEGQTAKVIADFNCRIVRKLRGYDNLVAAGGVDGLIVLKREESGWQTIKIFDELNDEIYDIQQIGSETSFWVRTIAQGIFRIDFANNFEDVEVTPPGENVFKEGQISLINYGGNVLFSQKKSIKEYDSNSGEFVESDLLESVKNKFLFRLYSSEEHTWISTGKGILHLLNGKVDSLSFQGIDVGGINAIFPDKGGNCWIGADDAILHYNASIQAGTQKLKCNIRKVIVGDSTYFDGFFFSENRVTQEQQNPLELDYENNNLNFLFAAMWPVGEEIEYSYQLVGYDAAFSKWTTENKAVYTNLSEGEYTFKVRARNQKGLTSDVAEYKFIINSPWYRTWWAYLLYVLVGIGVIILIVKLYARKLQREKLRLEEIVKERTRELDEKNKRLKESFEEIQTQKQIVESKNKDITDSIVYAEKIQKAMLVSESYMHKTFENHFLIYKPKDILSGDFYWAYRHKDTGKIIWCVADCTGHGVPGSLMSMLGNSLLNEIVIENKEDKPDVILNQLRAQIIKSLSHGSKHLTRDGMDMALCAYDPSTGVLEFAGAKNPLWLIRLGESEDLDCDRMLEAEGKTLYEWKGDIQPVGFSEMQKEFTVREVKVKKGDMIFLFTDGYADQFGGPDFKKMQQKHFRKMLLDQPMDCAAIEVQLDSYFDNWKGTQEQIDDVCVLGVKL